ncbi:MAG: DNA cytosine methyltransferase [Candidatus Nanopelagicales bacterium]
MTVVEICAGAGGQTLGLHLAGFEHRVAVELDPTAAATLRHNLRRLHPSCDPVDIVRIGDVADGSVWNPEDYVGVDLLAGGVPCPPFSVAGRQLGANDERDLLAYAIELVARIKPRAVLLENVRGLSASRFAGYRQAVLDRLEELGYWADWRLLEARDFGVPQLRPRFVLVAMEEAIAPYFSWPEERPTGETVGTTLLDLMAENGWRGARRWAERASGIAPTIVGGSKKHGGADLGPTRAKRAWAALSVDGLGLADAAPSADAPEIFSPKLTCEMVARLQGWNGPEYEWHFEGRKTSKYRQIGNAFPPPVARAVGESIARALRGEGEITVDLRQGQVHDEVYRALRDSDRWLTAGGLVRVLGGGFTAEDVEARIEHLDQDFVIERKARGGRLSYRLAGFKAFLGQEDHMRQEAFVDLSRKAKIS